ncbi:hypothetical protein TOPH_05413 [Tolypocladium ophioglossoides CBS 100239]|uniref:Uncharacterized protein n=1 Tax=Tolypocladium ophioglossoides (strain CBS 100239) TaxID=1163406 RepID=A0A0L0N751_TOLOC|nr:hypothetical protein TOPH_05413 [Tolypocladium ophioglossoides CBS 100239]
MNHETLVVQAAEVVRIGKALYRMNTVCRVSPVGGVLVEPIETLRSRPDGATGHETRGLDGVLGPGGMAPPRSACRQVHGIFVLRRDQARGDVEALPLSVGGTSDRDVRHSHSLTFTTSPHSLPIARVQLQAWVQRAQLFVLCPVRPPGDGPLPAAGVNSPPSPPGKVGAWLRCWSGTGRAGWPTAGLQQCLARPRKNPGALSSSRSRAHVLRPRIHTLGAFASTLEHDLLRVYFGTLYNHSVFFVRASFVKNPGRFSSHRAVALR